MACVYKNKEDALIELKKWLELPNASERLINNLNSEYYSNSDIELILEAIDGNTNHVIKEENE